MERLFKVREVADVIREDPMTVYRRIRNGEIAAIRFGRRSVRISEGELARWIKERTEQNR
jgi:excisionase family DNA binding protein